MLVYMNKTIFIVLLAAVLLASCGSSSHTERQANGQTSKSKAHCPKLEQLGIDVSKIPTLDGKVEYRNSDNMVSLNPAQVRSLLNDVYHLDLSKDENDMEGGFYIAGLRPLAGDHTLVLFHIEYGDGAGRELAIYDQNGKMTDFLDTGAWDTFHPDENSDYIQGKAYHELMCCEFNDDRHGFTLKRDYALCDYCITDDGTTTFGTIHWALLKNYRYTINGDGHFVHDGTDIEKKGPVDPRILLLDEISDLNYIPASDPARLEKMATLLQRDEVQQELAHPEGLAAYVLLGVMQSAFEQNAPMVLGWMAANRHQTAVIELLRKVFASGWLRKERMIQELEKLPDGEARTWLDQLTAQWGPDGAVG